MNVVHDIRAVGPVPPDSAEVPGNAHRLTGGHQVTELPSALIRPIDTSALSADVDLTVDPADPTAKLGPASGIYSAGGGAVALQMVGSSTPSTITLAPGGSRSVGISKLLEAGTTTASVEVSWG